MSNLQEIAKGFLDGLRPVANISLDDWSDQNIRLSTEMAAEPGEYRTGRSPYLREICKKLSANDPTQEVIVMKGAQLGFTQLGLNWLGYIIDIAPASTLVVEPTVDIAENTSQMKFAPMVQNCRPVRDKILQNKGKAGGGSTILKKRYPGGTAIFAGANAAAGLRSMSIKNLMLDEVDAYPLDVEGEGSPVDLAIKRTNTYEKTKKILKISTPTVEGVSVIEKEFERSDKRYYFVPCPDCGSYQILKWENIKWEGEAKNVHYVCEHCSFKIEERHKTRMLEAGEWRVTAPANIDPIKVGYHLSGLYAPDGWLSWASIVKNWIEARNDVNKLKTFVNTVLGETWKDKGEAPAWSILYDRRSKYPTNKPQQEITFLTAGVDVQKDRLELEVVGWCKGKISYSIDYRVIEGDTQKRAVWDKLAEVMDERWERADGLLLPIKIMAVDSGYNTSYVYDFCNRFSAGKVIPTKGSDALQMIFAAPKATRVNRKGKKIEATKVYHIGSSFIKQELYGWLKLQRESAEETPPGYCFFPQYGETYFRGLTAEQLMSKYNNKGYRVYYWVKKYERNEPLDCRVMARAAASVFGMDRLKDSGWEALHLNYLPADQPEAKPKPKPQQSSSFWADQKSIW